MSTLLYIVICSDRNIKASAINCYERSRVYKMKVQYSITPKYRELCITEKLYMSIAPLKQV